MKFYSFQLDQFNGHWNQCLLCEIGFIPFVRVAICFCCNFGVFRWRSFLIFWIFWWLMFAFQIAKEFLRKQLLQLIGRHFPLRFSTMAFRMDYSNLTHQNFSYIGYTVLKNNDLNFITFKQMFLLALISSNYYLDRCKRDSWMESILTTPIWQF